LGVIRNNIRIHNIFREIMCHKYTSDSSRNRNIYIYIHIYIYTYIYIREFLRKKKSMNMNEQAVYKNILICANKPTTPTQSRGYA